MCDMLIDTFNAHARSSRLWLCWYWCHAHRGCCLRCYGEISASGDECSNTGMCQTCFVNSFLDGGYCNVAGGVGFTCTATFSRAISLVVPPPTPQPHATISKSSSHTHTHTCPTCDHACRMLIGACNPMVCPIDLFQAVAMIPVPTTSSAAAGPAVTPESRR